MVNSWETESKAAAGIDQSIVKWQQHLFSFLQSLKNVLIHNDTNKKCQQMTKYRILVRKLWIYTIKTYILLEFQVKNMFNVTTIQRLSDVQVIQFTHEHSSAEKCQFLDTVWETLKM